MARIRSIKPDLPASRDIAKVSIEARYLHAILLCQYDDEGRLEYSPKKLAGVLFPWDDNIDGKDIERWIKELCEATILVLYKEGESTVLWSPTFLTHQVINRPSTSTIPAYNKNTSQLIHGTITESSLSTHPRKGREGNKEGRGKGVQRETASLQPPTVEDVRVYALETFQLNSTFAQDFVTANEAKCWKDSKGKPYKNWKLLVGTWVKHLKPDEAAKYQHKPPPDNSMVKR